jgi:hypothetical protein
LSFGIAGASTENDPMFHPGVKSMFLAFTWRDDIQVGVENYRGSASRTSDDAFKIRCVGVAVPGKSKRVVRILHN